jgi:anti-sigma regulatory factor (Ser/Thr protein kinase)
MLGDFTGHGLNAAIGAMPLAQTFYEMLGKGFLLTDILQGVNRKLYEVLPTDLFCCAIFVEINYREGKIQVWNGGLPDCQLVYAGSGVSMPLPSTHLPLGIRPAHQFDDSLESYEVSPGDRLLLWTDGIFEALDAKGNMFGVSRLQEVIDTNYHPPALFSEINKALAEFIGEGDTLDDISLIEVTMVEPEKFHYQGRAYSVTATGGGQWSLRYELHPASLRYINPLPQLLYILMDTPYLRAYGGQIYTVLSELFTNALEHGLLGLESTAKDTEQGFSEYYLDRGRRLQSLQHGAIIITLDYQGEDSTGRLLIKVEDSGAGFDFRPHARPSNDYSGRGISLIEGLCDSVEYNDKGNSVQAVFSWRA